jgi:Ectodermal ciliogenesis protein
VAAPYAQSPVLEMPIAIVVLVVNLVFPGIGTLVAGVVGKHPMIGRGIAQLLLSIIIVGWVWALVTSIQCLTNANSDKKAA